MSGPVTHIHHSAICTRAWDESVRFWQDGIGLRPMMENTFQGDWTTLFKASGDTLRSIFLGNPERPDSGIVEIVEFPTGVDDGAPPVAPRVGFFLLSLYVDVEATLARLGEIGIGGEPRRITVPTGDTATLMAVVRDPNGVIVELIGVGQG